MTGEKKKAFKVISKMKDAWYAVGNSIEGIPEYEGPMEKEFIGLTKDLLKGSKGVHTDLEVASQELRGVMAGRSGEIKKLHRESAASIERLIQELEDYLDTLTRMVEYKKKLPELQKKHGALTDSLKKQAAGFQEHKERYDRIKSAYDKKQGGISRRFDTGNSSIFAEFSGALLPIMEGCSLRISGSTAGIEELYNIAVVEGVVAKIDIVPVSAKGLKGILSGKEATEIKTRLDFIKLQVNESRASFNGIKEERFQSEERLLEEFSEMPRLHRDLEEMEEGIKRDKASEEELHREISGIEEFLTKKSRFSGKAGVLHIRDSLLGLYNSAHSNLRPFFDFCQKNIEGFEFPQKDIEKRELQSKVRELETKLDELYKEKDSLGHTLKKTQKDLKETDFILTKTERELNDVTSSLEESNALAVRLKENLKELNQAHDTLRLESEDLSRTVERLSPLEDLKKQLDVEVSALKKQGRERTSKIKALESENEELKSEVALLKKLGEENVDLKSEVKKLSEELAETEVGLAASSEKLTEESSQRQKLEGELKEGKVKISTLTKQGREKTSKIKALESENEELKSEV
ncbi:MAG: hypothetical protein ACE5HH_00425, partial [Candidatus Hydrothermarchaeales archaeon]